jgi:hypothetical protein
MVRPLGLADLSSLGPRSTSSLPGSGLVRSLSETPLKTIARGAVGAPAAFIGFPSPPAEGPGIRDRLAPIRRQLAAAQGHCLASAGWHTMRPLRVTGSRKPRARELYGLRRSGSCEHTSWRFSQRAVNRPSSIWRRASTSPPGCRSLSCIQAAKCQPSSCCCRLAARPRR